MDKFDHAILRLLTENARQPVASIGNAIGLSRSAVNDRIRKLEDQGVIRRYTIDQGDKGDRNRVCAYFELTFRPFDMAAVGAAVQSIPEIRQAHALSGSTDVMVFAEADSMEQLNRVRQQLAELPQLERIVTATALERLI